jgi:hypothetical protein
VAPNVELAGISVVGVGTFNPAIFHPYWFADKELIAANAIDEALSKDFMAVREVAAFTADWLAVQVTLDQAVFSTVEQGREFDLRDVAKAVFDLLPETPVNAVGINADAHFRAESEDAWHAFGDHFLPKDFWEPLFGGEQWRRRPDGQAVGMRAMAVEAWRQDIEGYVRTEVAPSVRLTPNGIYAGVNAHFQLTVDEDRGNGYKAARVIEEHWDATRQLERELIERVLTIA